MCCKNKLHLQCCDCNCKSCGSLDQSGIWVFFVFISFFLHVLLLKMSCTTKKKKERNAQCEFVRHERFNVKYGCRLFNHDTIHSWLLSRCPCSSKFSAKWQVIKFVLDTERKCFKVRVDSYYRHVWPPLLQIERLLASTFRGDLEVQSQMLFCNVSRG